MRDHNLSVEPAALFRDGGGMPVVWIVRRGLFPKIACNEFALVSAIVLALHLFP